MTNYRSKDTYGTTTYNIQITN